MNSLASKLGHQFVISVEVDPPRGPDASELLARLADLPPVDAINVADSPMARVRMSAVALGYLIQSRLGVEPLLHYTCRDKNVVGIQSELLGAAALGLHNLLVITGDPLTVGDYPWATSVFELSSVQLLGLVSGLNSGQCLGGKPLEAPCDFFPGAAVNLLPADFDTERAKLMAKLEAGARFLISQPLYDLSRAEPMLELVETFKIPLLVGLLPLRSSKLADYLHFEVPGISVPDSLRDSLAQAATPEAQSALGLAKASELLAQLKTRVQGVCIMPLSSLELVEPLLMG